MIVAVLALAIARLPSAGVAAIAVPSATASPTASPTARPTPRATPRPSPSASAAASAPASPSPAASGVVSGVTATPTPSSPPETGEIYVVKKGDTLYGIALEFDSTVDLIKSLNNLTSNDLKIGQKLKIP